MGSGWGGGVQCQRKTDYARGTVRLDASKSIPQGKDLRIRHRRRENSSSGMKKVAVENVADALARAAESGRVMAGGSMSTERAEGVADGGRRAESAVRVSLEPPAETTGGKKKKKKKLGG